MYYVRACSLYSDFKQVIILSSKELSYRSKLFSDDLIFWCFNATFNNISAISWRPVLVVQEA